jgi:hypothetical protein
VKNILGWVKSNVVVVASLLVILVAIPAGFVFASGWNKKIRTAREAEAKEAIGALSPQKTTVNYSVPAAMPGEKSLEVKAVPSKELTAWFAAERAKVKREVEEVVKEATAFNNKGRQPLIDGLFPQPANARERDAKLLEFIGVLSGRRDGSLPSAYATMLQKYGAGDKAEAGKIATALKDLDQRVRDSNGNRPLTNDELDELTKQLVDRRIGELRRRAQEVSFFASPASFSTPQAKVLTGYHRIPVYPGADVPTLEQAFVFQWDFWVLEDIVAAVARANTSADGDPLPVEQAPVKRIVSLNVKLPAIPGYEMADRVSQAGSRESEGSFESGVEPPFPGGVPIDKRFSITGRKSDVEANKVYDVRVAELEVIVASDRVQTLLSALSQTNFMTVIDLDMENVDVWAELGDGYYYGPDHVVKATIMVETIWLRSWMTPYMPFSIANNIGAELPEDEGSGGE